MRGLHDAARALRRLSSSAICSCLRGPGQPGSPLQPARPRSRLGDEDAVIVFRKDLNTFLGAETESEQQYLSDCQFRAEDEPMPIPPPLDRADEAASIHENECSEHCSTCHPTWIARRTTSTEAPGNKSETRLRKKSFSRAEQGKHTISPTMALDGEYLPFLRQRSVRLARRSTSRLRNGSLDLRREHILAGCGHRVLMQSPEPCGTNCACSADNNAAVQHTRVCQVCVTGQMADRYATTEQQIAESFVGDAMNRTSILDALLDPDQARYASFCYDLDNFRGYRHAELGLYEQVEPELKRWKTIRAAEVAYDTGRQMEREARSLQTDAIPSFRQGVGRSKSERRRSDYRGAFRTQEMASIKRLVEGELERSKSYHAAKSRSK